MLLLHVQLIFSPLFYQLCWYFSPYLPTSQIFLFFFLPNFLLPALLSFPLYVHISDRFFVQFSQLSRCTYSLCRWRASQLNSNLFKYLQPHYYFNRIYCTISFYYTISPLHPYARYFLRKNCFLRRLSFYDYTDYIRFSWITSRIWGNELSKYRFEWPSTYGQRASFHIKHIIASHQLHCTINSIKNKK